MIATGYQIGYVAWGIGAIVGFAVAALAQKQDTIVGISAAGLSLLGLLVGKAIILQWLLSPSALMGEIGVDLKDPEVFIGWYTGHMIDQQMFEPGLQARIDRIPEDQDWPETLEIEVAAAVRDQTSTMTQDQRDDFMHERGRAVIGALLADESYGSLLATTFSPFDALWFLLALSTAYKIGSGGGDSG